MKISFKAYGPCVDHLILGLAKSGIPVSASVSELRAMGVGESIITADFPSATPDDVAPAFKMPTVDVAEMLYGESKTATPTVSEEERTFF